jgi:hypothetical protein
MKRVKTAKGQVLDMAALAAKHENTRAVSNLNMNARGDIIDNRNNVEISREDIANKYYDKTVPGVTEPVSIQAPETDTTPVDKPAKKTATKVTEVSRTARTRDNGSQYFEVEYSDGTMEDIETE